MTSLKYVLMRGRRVVAVLASVEAGDGKQQLDRISEVGAPAHVNGVWYCKTSLNGLQEVGD